VTGTSDTTSLLRVTPMVILKDIAPVLNRYESLGFQRVDAGTAGCVGMRAGTTAVIFASVGFMNEDYDRDHVARLVGRTIQYVHVSSVDEVKGRLTASARVLQDVITRGGTRELLVEDHDDVLILAEMVEETLRERVGPQSHIAGVGH
jgi:hypothetical protein